MNLDNISKKIILTLLIIFVFSYSPQEPEAIAGLALPKIGGRITYHNPITCRVPSSINFITIQPVGGIGSGSWMFLVPGSISFSYLAPKNPGQQVLGLAFPTYIPCLTPCHAGLCATGPGGLQVWYLGGDSGFNGR